MTDIALVTALDARVNELRRIRDSELTDVPHWVCSEIVRFNRLAFKLMTGISKGVMVRNYRGTFRVDEMWCIESGDAYELRGPKVKKDGTLGKRMFLIGHSDRVAVVNDE